MDEQEAIRRVREMAAKDKSNGYTVGYGKPPPGTRFKKGQSGNPKGRVRGTRDLKTDLSEELAEQITVTEGGRTRRVSKQRAIVKRLAEQALRGDMRATNTLISLITRAFGLEDIQPESIGLAADDREILAAFQDRYALTDSSMTSEPDGRDTAPPPDDADLGDQENGEP
ncbi:MAG: hypothetical protein ACI8S3_001421 [Alphaproteobacteria bacterium]|jgi:hypothetical protein